MLKEIYHDIYTGDLIIIIIMIIIVIVVVAPLINIINHKPLWNMNILYP